MNKSLRRTLTKDDIENVVDTVVKREVKESERRLSGKLDSVMGELKDIREEFTLHQGQHDDITDTLDNHNSRLKKLEHVQV